VKNKQQKNPEVSQLAVFFSMDIIEELKNCRSN